MRTKVDKEVLTGLLPKVAAEKMTLGKQLMSMAVHMQVISNKNYG